jgi:hypothetical protein
VESSSATTTTFIGTSLDCYADSRTWLKGPEVDLDATRITTKDRATLRLQFDDFTMKSNLVRFILAPGKAIFQCDGYSVNDPFDFIN